MPDSVPDARVLDLLRGHRALGAAPAAEHAWLAAHGSIASMQAGEVLVRRGTQATALHIVFAGRFVIRADRGAGAHKIYEWGAGDCSGAMPYSRGASPPNDVVAEAPVEMLVVPKEHFPELTRECPVVTAELVHAMIDRARQFNTADLRDEKLISLGRLAAGLAHELNNPASAAVRSAKMLAAAQLAADTAARRLGAAQLTPAQLVAIDAVQVRCRDKGAPIPRTALERADREDAIGDWLRAHGADEEAAGPLAETSLSIAELDALAGAVRDETLDAALRWVASGCALRALASEIEIAASRIHDLVGSVKGFTFMDHAPAVESVDVGRGLRDTVTMLGGKTRAKDASVTLDIAEGLPCARGVGAELNQVWMNLVDNALDAIAPSGHIAAHVAMELGRVTVRIEDDGPGIPAGMQGRIFDPFFTTKGVGKGTGLGLDIVRRLVQKHEGDIEVESRPGRTVFRVSLPAVQPAGGTA